ncbi:MAG: nitroreductase [Halobacteriota archaeon]
MYRFPRLRPTAIVASDIDHKQTLEKNSDEDRCAYADTTSEIHPLAVAGAATGTSRYGLSPRRAPLRLKKENKKAGAAMDVIETLNSRFTVRAFKPDPIDTETILQIVGAATRAPSSGNTQPWELFVVGGDALDRLRQAYAANFQKGVPATPDIPAPREWPPTLQKRVEESRTARLKALGIVGDGITARHAMSERAHQFFGAPTIMFLCMDRTLTSWSVFDMGLLAQSIMLAAQHFGVDSAPAFLFVAYPDLIRSEVGIPDNWSIVMGVALGHRDPHHLENQYRSSRRPIQDVVHFRGVPPSRK